MVREGTLLILDHRVKGQGQFNHCAVLSKFVGPVGQPDIFYECPTKNVSTLDQMSDRKYKNIHLVDEKMRNTSGHKGQQLGFMSSRPREDSGGLSQECVLHIPSVS